MTEEQFNALPKQLQIWALRENKVLYVGFGVAPESDRCVYIGLELGKHYPHILRKYELRNYNSVEIVTLDNKE
jgi:hypothetical protein